ncbi:bifunctional lysylphosphatidylglycerol flippase/synthetase MprF [Nakamurella aerolata]|uniref:DUF2156 domain-containing protein n=1 Tax=Nakamurella aerolata TaxID=1656892 RepID=A0A849AD30_9ACTN|nr:DUF2156 domain-containing protein [Nakamurella aerolata]NNG36380.1 DUF2156 domain-containing protein [Nakamurella aerolata]
MMQTDSRAAASTGERADAEVAGGPAARVREFGTKVLALARRRPFTAGYVTLTMVLAVATGALWDSIESRSWYDDIAYGLPAFADGKWWTLVTGLPFAIHPWLYIFVAGAFALVCGYAEGKLGTRRTAVITLGYQFVAILLTALILWIFKDSSWEWARVMARETDVGLSAGMMAVISVASAAVPPPWRLRLRLAIWAYVLFAFTFLGLLADLEHLLAVLLSLPIASRLAGPALLKAPARPTVREFRLLAFVAAWVSVASQWVLILSPDRLTPFGPSGANTDAWWVVALNFVITALIANALRRGRRWAYLVELVLLTLSLVLLLLIWALVAVPDWVTSADEFAPGDFPQLVTGTVVVLGELALLVWARSAFKVPRGSKRRQALGTSQQSTAKELLQRYGGGSLSWMSTWPENIHFISADGQAYLAFRRYAGVAIGLGDPIGPLGSAATVLGEFIDMCDRIALVPCLFSCSGATAALTAERGWQSVQVAEDTLVDLPDLEFKGKKWQDVRTAINKAAKQDVEFRLVTLADEPWSTVRRVEQISQEWLGNKELPEMGFTLGGVDEALDREVRVGLAVGPDGTLHGVTSWLPVYGPDGVVRGWTLDLMRRVPDGFKPTVEFLIGSACMAFKAEGAQVVSLSGAPLVRSDPGGERSPVEAFLDGLSESLEPVYGFRSLHFFKQKFQPRVEPMYLAFRDEADLPRIGVALTRAFLPDAGLKELLSIAGNRK